jgi:hypothetical protein
MQHTVGDSGGEHLDMRRGYFTAWIHVILSFVLEVLIFWVLFAKLLEHMYGVTDATDGMVLVSGIASGTVSTGIYWNRWKCIEAFASRFCTGVINASLIYVPEIALIYANYRGLLKLFRR